MSRGKGPRGKGPLILDMDFEAGREGSVLGWAAEDVS